MDLVNVGVLLLAGFVGLITFAIHLYFIASSIPTTGPPLRKLPLEILYPGPENDGLDETEIDIIAVHGLGADIDWTWTRQSKDKRVNWLKDPDMLPTIVPKARIMIYTYDSSWQFSGSKTFLQRCGEDMVRRIHDFRHQQLDRPIIFLGHSLGGIVIEYGLLFARRHQELEYIAETTVGCVFLGTPFRGTKASTFYLKALSMHQSGIVRNLAYDNAELVDTLYEFSNLVRNMPIPLVCFYEQYKTNFGRRFRPSGLFHQLIVPEESATIPGWSRFGLQTDHLHMNKFSSPVDQSFLIVSAEIRKMYENSSIVLRKRRSRSHTHKPVFMVPFGRNEHFVGRTSILQQLLDRIPPDANYDTCQRTALEGLGGIGKTQIAIEAIYRLRHQDPECSIFWVSASTFASFENAYYEIGQLLQILGTEDVQVDIKPLIKVALSQQELVSKWLLVIDNADDPDLLFRGPSLAQFLPFSRNGSILFTTRNRQAALGLRAMPIKVESMQLSEALVLLGSDVEPSLVGNENEASTRELLCILAYLPLAITQASAFLNENQVSSTEYLEVFKSNEDDMIHLLSRDFEAHGRYTSDINPVAATFLVSINQLRRLNLLAVEYLQLISFLDEKDIPYAILPPAKGEARMMEAIGELKAFAFIRQRHADSFDIHRLVQVSVRRWVMASGDWDVALEAALCRLSDVLPSPEHQSRDVWTRYLPHVLSVLKLGQEEDNIHPIVTRLMSNTGRWLNEMGKYEEAAAMFKEVIEKRRSAIGSDHPDTLSAMNNYAAILFEQGRLEEAMVMLTKVLEKRDGILGHDYPHVLSSMNNLALTLGSLGKIEDAIAIHKEVLHERQRILGDDHPSTISAMSNLASTLSDQGKLDEAGLITREVLEKRQRILGDEHPDTITAMHNLASILSDQGKLDEAGFMRREVFEKRQRILGDDHPSTISAMSNLAATLSDQGKLDEAGWMLRVVLDKMQRILGDEHPSTISAMNNLASTLGSQGKLDEAGLMLREVFAKMQRILGDEHPSTISAMNNLASILSDQGKLDEAGLIMREVLEKRQRIHGDEHPDTITAMNNLASILSDQGKLGEAGLMRREVFEKRQRILGHEHPSTALRTRDLISTRMGQSKIEQEVEVKAETYN